VKIFFQISEIIIPDTQNKYFGTKIIMLDIRNEFLDIKNSYSGYAISRITISDI